jgi:uncharacterized membrane protein
VAGGVFVGWFGAGGVFVGWFGAGGVFVGWFDAGVVFAGADVVAAELTLALPVGAAVELSAAAAAPQITNAKANANMKVAARFCIFFCIFSPLF